MIKGLLDSGAMPALERLVQFTGARHKLLVDDVANLSTPFFKPRDLDPASFQASLRGAIDDRRRQPNPTRGGLNLRDTREISFKTGRVEVKGRPMNDNILFHDRNNRDLERIMQHLAENTMAHNAGVDLLRNQFDLLKTAIRGRL